MKLPATAPDEAGGGAAPKSGVEEADGDAENNEFADLNPPLLNGFAFFPSSDGGPDGGPEGGTEDGPIGGGGPEGGGPDEGGPDGGKLDGGGPDGGRPDGGGPKLC